jgi:purine-binding chemotaxis protein CheW
MTRVNTAERFATFTVHGLLFGIDVLRVQEVVRGQPLMAVPLAAEEVAGLINLRGQIVTAVRLDTKLGLGSGARLPATPETVVVSSAHGAVSLVVDAIEDVVSADDTAFERPPENLDRQIREFVTGVFKLKDRILFVLDADRVTDRSDAAREQ